MPSGNLKKVVQDLVLDTSLHLWYMISKAKLYYKTKLVIPKESIKIPLFLKFGLKAPQNRFEGDDRPSLIRIKEGNISSLCETSTIVKGIS